MKCGGESVPRGICSYGQGVVHINLVRNMMFEKTKSLSDKEQPRIKAPSSFLRKAAWFAAVLIGFFVISSSWFKVEPTERGNVRRFGVVQYDKPLQPGLHFKLPLIDDADKLQVSLTTVHIPPFDVTTVDNQKVTLEINFNYTIPDEKVNHVMYEIGRSGNTDIDSQVVPVVKDRTGRIFSAQNMVSVNASRSAIQTEIEKDVAKTVGELFGIQPHSLQIAAITPSPAFMASNEEAVNAKNAAENTKKTKQFEALISSCSRPKATLIRRLKRRGAGLNPCFWRRGPTKPGRCLKAKVLLRGWRRKSSLLARRSSTSPTSKRKRS